jgi:hypothetical protein
LAARGSDDARQSSEGKKFVVNRQNLWVSELKSHDGFETRLGDESTGRLVLRVTGRYGQGNHCGEGQASQCEQRVT